MGLLPLPCRCVELLGRAAVAHVAAPLLQLLHLLLLLLLLLPRLALAVGALLRQKGVARLLRLLWLLQPPQSCCIIDVCKLAVQLLPATALGQPLRWRLHTGRYSAGSHADMESLYHSLL